MEEKQKKQLISQKRGIEIKTINLTDNKAKKN